MKNNRVLITTYQTAFLHAGGGEVELKSFVTFLQKVGVKADFYGNSSLDIDAYNIVLHFSMAAESYTFVKELKLMGKTIILWPNLWWVVPPKKETVERADDFLQLADIIIFKSESELKNISKFSTFKKEKSKIIPWLINLNYLNDAPSGLFRNIYNLDKYILSVGMIESGKNQLDLIKNLKEIDIPCVFIGNYREPEYFSECIQEGSENTFFIPFMEPASDILRSAYKDCSVYIEVSKEPAGMSALEASLFEKPMILGRNEWSIEHFKNNVALIDPGSDIIPVVNDALEGHYKFTDKEAIVHKHLGHKALNPLLDIIKIINGD